MFLISTACIWANGQNSGGRLAACIIHRIMFPYIWFGHSASPFWNGVSVAVGCSEKPLLMTSSQNSRGLRSSPP
jgi:hypothetical protein